MTMHGYIKILAVNPSQQCPLNDAYLCYVLLNLPSPRYIGEKWHSVASPGFVARRGKDGNYVMGHSRWTLGPGAAAAR